jgi:hypothetical protein
MSPITLRRLSLPLCALLLSTSAFAQGADESFQAAVEAYRSGDTQAAADALKALLAENPSNEDAFRMWEAVEQQTIRDMLLERGELGALAERFLGLARMGQQELVADPGNAAEVVDKLLNADGLEREKAILTLRAQYGSWAVPALVGPLADRSSTDNRVYAIQALVHLGSAAVLPLVAALQSDDELLRRNAAAVLGTLGDPRAAAGLAWMAQADSDPVNQQVAAEALSKMGKANADAVAESRTLAEGYFRGDEEFLAPYGSATVLWSWNEGKLEGRPVLSGLYPLELAESFARTALERGAGDTMRPLLAAIHAAQKAEITAAARLPGLEGNELLAAAQERLPKLEVDLALAGSHRGKGLIACLAGGRRQVPAAVTLMDAMGSSLEERQALKTALVDGDAAVAFAAAMALARQGDADPSVVARLATGLVGVPPRTVMSLGDTGLSGSTGGWQLLTSDAVGEGLLRAKALPPKDVIAIQDGLQGKTLDSLVFALKNDPRTAGVPLVIVTQDVEGVTALYGDKVAKIVATASWADVGEVAGERSAEQADAADRARRAADALGRLPASIVRAAAGEVTTALQSATDDGVRSAVLPLAAYAGITEALPAVEALVLDESLAPEVRALALRTAARLWALNSGATGSSEALGATLLAMVSGGDAALALPAAEALGQLRGIPDATIATAVQ